MYMYIICSQNRQSAYMTRSSYLNKHTKNMITQPAVCFYILFIIVWVATGLEVYLLVDLSTVLQKQHAGITEDTRKMDLMAVKGIYKEIITSHSSFLVRYFYRSCCFS